jgi:hypothetical protein
MKPTITQLIDLLNKPALIKWANKIGLNGVDLDEYRNNLKYKGTSIHKQIENYIKYNIKLDNIEDQNNFDKYFVNKKIISYEKKIETDYFIGRLDIIIEYKNNKFICDFKSNQKNVYFENKLQLVAYNMYEKIDNLGIISVPDFKYIPVIINDYKKYENILICLSNIYKLKNEIENGN